MRNMHAMLLYLEPGQEYLCLVTNMISDDSYSLQALLQLDVCSKYGGIK